MEAPPLTCNERGVCAAAFWTQLSAALPPTEGGRFERGTWSCGSDACAERRCCSCSCGRGSSASAAAEPRSAVNAGHIGGASAGSEAGASGRRRPGRGWRRPAKPMMMEMEVERVLFHTLCSAAAAALRHQLVQRVECLPQRLLQNRSF